MEEMEKLVKDIMLVKPPRLDVFLGNFLCYFKCFRAWILIEKFWTHFYETNINLTPKLMEVADTHTLICIYRSFSPISRNNIQDIYSAFFIPGHPKQCMCYCHFTKEETQKQ